MKKLHKDTRYPGYIEVVQLRKQVQIFIDAQEFYDAYQSSDENKLSEYKEKLIEDIRKAIGYYVCPLCHYKFSATYGYRSVIHTTVLKSMSAHRSLPVYCLPCAEAIHEKIENLLTCKGMTVGEMLAIIAPSVNIG